MARIYNFSSGPAVLPLPVLEKAQAELLEYPGSGMSILEMSHRSKTYDAIIKAAEANIRQLMGIPDSYAVLFLPGGASQQFAMVPLNLLPAGGFADYVHTGAWAGKAIKEAEVVGRVKVVWDGRGDNYMRTPRPAELKFNPGSAYVHLCSNETIGGVRFPEFPKTNSPLVADMSSDIMSRVIDVSNFGLIYAGLQKNLGPAGSALVIIRRDLAEKTPESGNLFFRYATHMKEPSLYNTPNTFAIYILKLVSEWLAAEGGLAAMEARNQTKASLLYQALDTSPFWRPCARKDSRSLMNITWRLENEELEARFVQQAKAAGLDGLKGHRSVGGLRASLYNAFPLEGVRKLVEFMQDFEQKNG
ncbi:MAG: 3-phosphoserine/phosphohydroxythreonine transaminase [Planctomycetota bacterium]|jgi:phosphoserine aminotransferase|nr:3-phosphoserine/phosphohydroxythreonine transaminase [Planctomycetota bacterium]